MTLLQIEILLVACEGAEDAEQKFLPVSGIFIGNVHIGWMIQQIIRGHMKIIGNPD